MPDPPGVAAVDDAVVRLLGPQDEPQVDPGELLPVDDNVEQARESLSAPSVKLLKTVAAAMMSNTDAVIRALSAKDSKVVFVLWGAYARKKTALIDTTRHAIITAPHPSPLSANRGFFGSRPFSRINAELEADGQKPI